MKWKDAFGSAMEELKAIRALLAPVGRLDDPTVGLTALHGDLTQTRLKILEVVQGGVTGLREENREVRRRQDRMISDLNETRGELQQLLELAVILRPLAELQRPADAPEADAPAPGGPAAPEPSLEYGYEPAASATAPPTSSDTDSQGGTMESNQQQPQPEPERQNRDQDDALKRAIQAAYQGNGTPAAPSSAPAPTGGEDPRVAHGVLLLKAAGVASVDLVAHRDTWEWLTALAVDHDHFRTPPSVEDVKEGRVQTVLSGRSLIGLLIKLWDTRHATTPLEADWALATTAYNRIATELTGVDGEGQTIRIVLDDGLPHETND
ncbi:hypothetical protein [Streptomyces glycanivorans]|uniref:Uncharacterized protein n=1 Tax=Streptomyces glycanivorans TaxID=3033808 RepID=A0ABY9JRX9_9ACTN|nr:hypothetical protein [Streptomyces sp. Alt3]WLQ69314.1 hypothetical protein P8A20_37995 [Streptomyces sp. Alt3]